MSINDILDDLLTGLTQQQHLNWKLDAQLRKADQLYSVDGRTVHLNFHEGQWQAWNSTARFIGVLAGTQGGKTSFGPWWLYNEVLRNGGGDYIGLAPTYDLFKLKMLPEMLDVFENTLGVGRYWRGDKVMELANPETGKFDGKSSDDPHCWGRIILRSAESKGGLESATAKAVWFDEAGQDTIRYDVIEAVLRRLSLSLGRVLYTTTIYNLGWLKLRLYDSWVKGDDTVEIVQFPSTANPSFPEAEMERAKASMPLWKYLMFYEGKFTRPPGLIYEDYVDEYHERGGHKCKPFAIPKDWNVFVGVDPGIINTAKLWLAHDPVRDIYYLFKEQLGDRKPAREHAEEALIFAHENRYRVVKWAVGAVSEKYHRDDWMAVGATGVVSPPASEVEKGIDAVIFLLKSYRLIFFETCTGTLEQMLTYSRVVDADGNTTDKIADKSTFHYLDALRYIALAIQMKSGGAQTPQAIGKKYV